MVSSGFFNTAAVTNLKIRFKALSTNAGVVIGSNKDVSFSFIGSLRRRCLQTPMLLDAGEADHDLSSLDFQSRSTSY